MASMNWAVICPGPSLNQVDHCQIMADPGCIVAVNGALLWDIMPDFWAIQDFDAFERIVSLLPMNHRAMMDCSRTVLWCPERFINDILRASQGVRFWYNTFLKDSFPNHPRDAIDQILPEWLRGIGVSDYTMTLAIALCVLKGAQTIQVLGADLSGSNYFRNDIKTSRTRLNQKRWEDEVRILRKLKRKARSHGVNIFTWRCYS